MPHHTTHSAHDGDLSSRQLRQTDRARDLVERVEPEDLVVTTDLDALLDVLPWRVREPLELRDVSNLLEIVLDLGRLPEARFPEGAVDLDVEPVTLADLEYVVERIGQF